jgi:Phosphotransferase enzyme family
VEREEPLAGGWINQVVRVGETVRRPTGAWTPAVHALLRHLAEAGFAGAPRVHGIDDRGREILDYIPGRVAYDPPPPWVHADVALRASGRLLRAFHDATVGFTPPAGAAWSLPPRRPAEVICHGDAAAYNTVYRDRLPVALIDFDTAHPGPRVWDLAYACYRLAPLPDPEREPAAPPLREQGRRLRVLVDAYGASGADRRVLVDSAVARLEAMIDQIRTDPAFTRHLAVGQDVLYRTDIRHLTRHRAFLTGAVTSMA